MRVFFITRGFPAALDPAINCGVGSGACDDLPPTGCRECITRLYPGGKAIAPISMGIWDREDTYVCRPRNTCSEEVDRRVLLPHEFMSKL